jgi:hypothetical protein
VLEAEIQRDYYRAMMYSKLSELLAENHEDLGVGLEFGDTNGTIRGMMPRMTWYDRPYPPHDIMVPSYWGKCDVAVADQVLEHVARPWEVFKCAVDSVRKMFIVTVPFLIKVHPCPEDYWRMTPECIRDMAQSAGFRGIHIDTWGNAQASMWLNTYWETSNMMSHVPEELWRPALDNNDPYCPIMIWAVLRP